MVPKDYECLWDTNLPIDIKSAILLLRCSKRTTIEGVPNMDGPYENSALDGNLPQRRLNIDDNDLNLFLDEKAPDKPSGPVGFSYPANETLAFPIKSTADLPAPFQGDVQYSTSAIRMPPKKKPKRDPPKNSKK